MSAGFHRFDRLLLRFDWGVGRSRLGTPCARCCCRLPVQNGAVTLEGQVRWNFERDAAEKSVRYLTGVVSIYNSITLKPETSAAQVKEKIQSALQRQATKDANSIHIDTAGSKVTLTGHASSWQSIEDAASAAWAAPGVTEVVDQVKMQMNY